MKVSVVIPAYNYAVYLEQCINSVFNQTYAEIECIVVNDGSSDNTLFLLDDLKQRRYPRLQVINKENGGLSSARNAGIKAATGELISFLDADDFWAPEKIQNQVTKLTENQADLVFSNYAFFDGLSFLDHNEKILETPRLMDFFARNPLLGSSSSVLVKRSMVEKVGLFDTKLNSLEDLDYWFRCAISGCIIQYCNSVDVFLRVHSNGNMSSNYRVMLFSHLITLERHYEMLFEKGHIKSNQTAFRKALRNRLGIIRWYAFKIERFDYSILTLFIGMRLSGLNYLFSKIVLVSAVKDLLSILRKR